jgi:hypothetical protein
MPVLDWEVDEGLVECALAAAAAAPSEVRIRAAVEAVVEFAETDPEAARAALWELRGDHATLALLEAAIGGGAKRATLALGAAIQLASAELASRDTDLRSRLPELMRWLEANW